jgi:transcriptional regulator with XRE-family HTH domain
MKNSYSSNYKILVGLLRTIRLDAGFSQADLAKILKLPQSFVSKYETGERRLDLLEVRRICIACGVSLEEFVKKLESALNAAK